MGETLPPKKQKQFTIPSIEEFKNYFKEQGYREDIAIKAWNGYDVAEWKDSQGKPVKSWKQKCQHVWFKEGTKIKNNKVDTKTAFNLDEFRNG